MELICERRQPAKIKSAAGERPALLGGEPVVKERNQALFHWPIVTSEDEEAVCEVLRAGTMSGTEITRKFEVEFADWMGVKYALGTCNGTAALQEAFYACEVGPGDEVIAPSMTYWAACTPAAALGAKVVFADIEPDTLCIDPADIERKITPRTKAIVVVHYAGYPADMDRIMALGREHGIKVIEDVSHAQGTMYKGRVCGSIGDLGGISMMGGKSFAIGEGGMFVTNERKFYERALSFGHYERVASSRYSAPSYQLADENLRRYAGIPLGGIKHRMNQTCAAMGRVQLRHYPARIAEIQKALNYFWDQLEGTPGIRAHRVKPDSGSTMGGWYTARGLYRSEELGGLSCEKFCEAVRAEGYAGCAPGANWPLHTHIFYRERSGDFVLPVSERIHEIAFAVPWFKHLDTDKIDAYAEIFRKVARNHTQLLKS